MKRVFTAVVAVVLMLAASSGPAWAKSPTAKITISGGTLTSIVDVTDPRILAISNVWYGQFIDASQGELKEPPAGLLRAYEVSFYIKISNNDVRRRYVLYYSPSPSAGQGFIYLPGKGETWYSLNVSAILRNGQDGKWNYASPAWEDLIKPVISRADAVSAKR